MIISKKSLLIREIVKFAKGLPLLQNLRIDKDGSCAVVGNMTTLVVSPVNEELKKSLLIKDKVEEQEEMIIPVDSIDEILKNIPADKVFNGRLEYCSIQKEKELIIDKKDENGVDVLVDTGKAEVIFKDGKRPKKVMTVNLFQREFVKYKEVIKKALQGSILGQRVVFDMKRFLVLMQTIEKLCSDGSGEVPVFIEFTEANDIIIRGINQGTLQSCIGVMHSYTDIEEKWFEHTNWEKSFYQKVLKKLKIKQMVKKKIKIKKKIKKKIGE